MGPITKQRGVGIVEVMIAALILAISVSGTVILMSDWFQGMNDASNRNDALARIGSVMEAGRYDPDSTEITTRANALTMVSPRATFSVDNISVTAGTGSDAFSARVNWTDPYLDDVDCDPDAVQYFWEGLMVIVGFQLASLMLAVQEKGSVLLPLLSGEQPVTSTLNLPLP